MALADFLGGSQGMNKLGTFLQYAGATAQGQNASPILQQYQRQMQEQQEREAAQQAINSVLGVGGAPTGGAATGGMSGGSGPGSARYEAAGWNGGGSSGGAAANPGIAAILMNPSVPAAVKQLAMQPYLPKPPAPKPSQAQLDRAAANDFMGSVFGGGGPSAGGMAGAMQQSAPSGLSMGQAFDPAASVPAGGLSFGMAAPQAAPSPSPSASSTPALSFGQAATAPRPAPVSAAVPQAAPQPSSFLTREQALQAMTKRGLPDWVQEEARNVLAPQPVELEIVELSDGRNYYIDPTGMQPPRPVAPDLPAPATARTVSGAQISQEYGVHADPNALYNVAPDGRISQVGGGA